MEDGRAESTGHAGVVQAVRDCLAWASPLLTALLGLANGVLKCSSLLVTAVVPLAVLGMSGQGREAMATAALTLSRSTYALALLFIASTILFSQRRLDLGESGQRTAAYAKRCVPTILGIVVAFAPALFFVPESPIDALTAFTRVGRALNMNLGSPPPQGDLEHFLVIAQFGALSVPLMTMGLTTNYETARRQIWLYALCLVIPYFTVMLTTDGRAVWTRFLTLLGLVITANWFVLERAPRPDIDETRSLTLVFAFVAMLVAMVMGVWILTAPATWGAPATVIAATLVWMVAAALLEEFLNWRPVAERPHLPEVTRFGALTLLILILVTGSFNEAPVRTREASSPRVDRTLEEFLGSWISARSGRPGERHPIFLITAEGGGIRAAYWTATVLGKLEDSNSQFARHILALSGVSGGSVGLSIFASLVNETRHQTRLSCGSAERCAQTICGADLLTAPLAAMLVGEPIHRLTGLGEGDRSIALERALELAWENATGTRRFSRAFVDLTEADFLLLPNATSADDGRRVVIWPVRTRNETRLIRWPFEVVEHVNGTGLALSTAALLSARFPVISPAGVLPTPDRVLRLVDGGYSDNSGAATATDVAKLISIALREQNLVDRFFPVVIALTYAGSEAAPNSAWRSQALGALADPLLVLDAARAATTRRFMQELRELVKQENGEFLELPLLDDAGELPLGWMLSGRTMSMIDARRRDLTTNPQYQRILELARDP
jgi:hypothetical protein